MIILAIVIPSFIIQISIEIINKNITLYDGLIAKEIIIEYISSSGKNLESLGLSDSGTKDRKALFTDIIFNNNKYTFSFEAYNDIFDKYLPIVNKILKSFRPYTDNYNSTDSIFRKSYKVNEDYKLFYNDNKPPMTLHNYTSAKFGYSIMYPPDWILEKPHISSDGKVMFFLPPTSNATLKDISIVEIDVFNKNETNKMRESLLLGFNDLKTFDFQGLIELANNKIKKTKEISTIPSQFTLINSQKTLFKNNESFTLEMKYYLPPVRGIAYEKIIYSLINDKLYVFGLTSTESQYSNSQIFFQEMLNSFKLDRNLSIEPFE